MYVVKNLIQHQLFD